jgi:hypothetical protein
VADPAGQGAAHREHDDERGVWIRGKEERVTIPWGEHFTRLEEIALADVLGRMAEALADDGEGLELTDLYETQLDLLAAAAADAAARPGGGA